MPDERPRLDPFKLGKRVEELGTQFAEDHKSASLLEDMKEVVLARLVLDIMERQPTISHAKASEMAKASVEYETHLNGKNEARAIANKTKAKIAGLDTFIRLSQTVDATTRALMQKGIFPS